MKRPVRITSGPGRHLRGIRATLALDAKKYWVVRLLRGNVMITHDRCDTINEATRRLGKNLRWLSGRGGLEPPAHCAHVSLLPRRGKEVRLIDGRNPFFCDPQKLTGRRPVKARRISPESSETTNG